MIGDVIAGVNNGEYDIFDNSGNFILTLNDGTGGFTTGAFYDTTNNLLYTTNFTNTTIVVYDGLDPHNIVDTIPTGPDGGGQCESIVFDANGDFYVGHALGDRDIKKYTASGTFLATFNVATENVGSDWIDLAADQKTIYYTSEGRRVMRYDVAADAQLADFALLPGGGNAFALRLLLPFDGSGGLIVADRSDIKRLDGAGNVVQTYDVAGEDNWFAMNLDPNGTSFWGGDFGTDNFYRFNIASGLVEVGPINTGGGGNLFGLAVVGEITGGQPQNNPPDCSGAVASQAEIWPPNHKFVDITVEGVTDPDGDPVTITITSITQDEPVNGSGDGNTCPDALIATSTAMVRRERAGTGDGRVYHVSFTASDGMGGECSGTVNVCVPHDQRPGHQCVDQGPLFDSTTCP